jgi:hypothetical protein
MDMDIGHGHGHGDIWTWDMDMCGDMDICRHFGHQEWPCVDIGHGHGDIWTWDMDMGTWTSVDPVALGHCGDSRDKQD